MATAIFELLGLDPARFMKGAYEISLISLFLICLAHSLATHGWSRTLREFVAGFVLTMLCESVGVLSGAYVYPGFHVYVLAVPFANPASWIACVYIIIEITNRLVFGRRAIPPPGRSTPAEPLVLFGGRVLPTLLVLAMIDATLALVVDLVMDPLATAYNWWVWVPCAEGVTTIGEGVVDPYNFDRLVFLTTPDNLLADFFGGFFPGGFRYPTRVLGIPLINFIAWFVFVSVFAFEFRWVESRAGWSERRKTLVLWGLILADVPVLALALIVPNV